MPAKAGIQFSYNNQSIFDPATSREMMWKLIVGFIALILAVSGGFYLSSWSKRVEREKASRLAEQFLLREGREISDYFGPVEGRSGATFQEYHWRSITSAHPPTELQVILGEDLICLYDVGERKIYKRISCKTWDDR